MNSELSYGLTGSGHFAASCLELLSLRKKPEWVITGAPSIAGRGLKLKNTPVWEKAMELGIPCFATAKLCADTERLEWLKNNRPEVILVIDFGQLIKEPVLSLAPLGCLNIHPSRLPQYRGSAPVQRAVMEGCHSTAVSIFRLDPGMDSGPILAQPELQIEPEDTSETLFQKAAQLGTQTLLKYLCEIPKENWCFTEQEAALATNAPKIDKSEGKIDWSAPPQEILNKVRAIALSPGVYFFARGKRVRLFEASVLQKPAGRPGLFYKTEQGPAVTCGDGALLLLSVQPEGKKRQPASDWARGLRIEEGSPLEEDINNE